MYQNLYSRYDLYSHVTYIHTSADDMVDFLLLAILRRNVFKKVRFFSLQQQQISYIQ